MAEHPWKAEAMRRLEALGNHVCSHDEREGGCPICADILQLESTMSATDYEAVTITVGISGASAAMQAGGMPRRGQINPDAASPEPSGYCPEPWDFDAVIADVIARRKAQDTEHGGPAHDDTHYYYDWCSFIGKFRERAYGAGMNSQWECYEDAMIDIAALAIAAIQSSRRVRHHGR